MSESNKRPPDRSFRAGHFEASVWRNEKQESGRTVVEHSIRLQKRYQDSDGNWQPTDYFFPAELADAELVIHKAREYVRLRESGTDNLE